MKDENESLLEENKRLRKNVDEFSDQKRKIKDLEKELAETKRTCEKSSRDFEEDKNRFMEQLKNTREELLNEKKAFENYKKQQNYEKHLKENQESSNGNDLKKEIIELRKKISAKETMFEVYRKKADDLEENLKQNKNLLRDEKANCQKYVQEIQAYRCQVESNNDQVVKQKIQVNLFF